MVESKIADCVRLDPVEEGGGIGEGEGEGDSELRLEKLRRLIEPFDG